jgi:hypothetical protein
LTTTPGWGRLVTEPPAVAYGVTYRSISGARRSQGWPSPGI